MFLSVCVIAGAVCDMLGKKQGDARLQENMYLGMLFSPLSKYKWGRPIRCGPLDNYVGTKEHKDDQLSL